MSAKSSIPDFEFARLLLRNAAVHFKLVFGLTATRPEVSYLETFSFGGHTAGGEELSLTAHEEEQAFTALEHCATYSSVVQIHTAFELIRQSHLDSLEPEVNDAFQISRLIRNAFAHNPFAPVWKIRGDCRDVVLTVPDVISLNTKGLDGESVRRIDYGGPVAVLRFLQYADSIITRAAQERKQTR